MKPRLWLINNLDFKSTTYNRHITPQTMFIILFKKKELLKQPLICLFDLSSSYIFLALKLAPPLC